MRPRAIGGQPLQDGPPFDILDAAPPAGFYLAQNGQGLWQLCGAEIAPQSIDFSTAYYRHRGGTEYLPKAFKGMAGGRILDATAGWARDAWLLAYRGFEVRLCERNPYLYVLLKQGIEQAQQQALTAAVAARLSLSYGDSRNLLAAAASFDAVYLDPMYPKRQKSAKVKQDMQVLQALLGEDSADQADNAALLQAALAGGCARVVVKRPAAAAPLGELRPHHSIHAPNTRFDVYLPRL